MTNEADRVIGFQGERLRQLRKRDGLSQAALAAELNTNQQEISDWETGRVIPETETITKILTYFRVRPDFIFNYSDDQEAPPAPEPSPEFLDDLINAVTQNDLSKLTEIVARIRKLQE